LSKQIIMPVHEFPRPEFKPFQIVVRIDGVPRRLNVIQTLKAVGEEQYKVMARNKTLVFSTNKPIVERRGLNNFPWKWKLIEGQLHNMYAREMILKAMEAHLRGKPVQDGRSYKDLR